MDLKLDMRLAAPERIPDAARERPREARQLKVSGRPYVGCVFAERQHSGSHRRKAAGNDALKVGTIDRYGKSRRTMDLAAFLTGDLRTVIVL
jgi:hypothetical protein